jgi:hypothetical protein
MNFADADWLVSLYLEPAAADAEAVRRKRTVARFMRRHNGPLAISHIVLLGRERSSAELPANRCRRNGRPWKPTLAAGSASNA